MSTMMTSIIMSIKENIMGEDIAHFLICPQTSNLYIFSANNYLPQTCLESI